MEQVFRILVFSIRHPVPNQENGDKFSIVMCFGYVFHGQAKAFTKPQAIAVHQMEQKPGYLILLLNYKRIYFSKVFRTDVSGAEIIACRGGF